MLGKVQALCVVLVESIVLKMATCACFSHRIAR